MNVDKIRWNEMKRNESEKAEEKPDKLKELRKFILKFLRFLLWFTDFGPLESDVNRRYVKEETNETFLMNKKKIMLDWTLDGGINIGASHKLK